VRLGVRIAGIVLAVAVLALAAFLVPPHLQTRRIAPRLPTAAELLALRDVAGGPTSIESLLVASQDSPRGTIGHSVFVARWADGRTFMIDAAMDRAGAADFAALLARIGGAGEDRFFGDMAEQLGPAIRDVRGVGFTHLHIDHTQGVGAFCAARGAGAAVYQTRWQAEEHNFNTTEGAEIVADSCLEPRRLEGEGLIPIEGFPGLAAVPLGGHTPGSTLFAVPVAGHVWLFSGDTTNSKASLVNDVGKGFLYSYVMVPENTARTRELRHWLAALDARDDMTVIVSHDPEDAAASGLPQVAAR
jgi:glyoxylase-like metal-dependent hydrolase (beta-lactamase superfamily II)